MRAGWSGALIALLLLGTPSRARAAPARVLTKAQVTRLEALIAKGRYRDVRKELAVLSLRIARASKRVQAKFRRVQAAFEKARATWLQQEVVARFVKVAKDLMREKAEAPKATASAALTWVRRRLAAEVAQRIARELAPRDRVTAGEVMAAWRTRTGRAWEVFVYPRYGQSRFVDVRERWWKRASSDQRETRLFQALLLDTDLLQLGTHDPKVPCTECKGTGILTKGYAHGREISTACPRCEGTRYERATRWR